MTRIMLSLVAITALSLTACQPFTPTALHQGASPQLNAEKSPVRVTLGAFAPKTTSSSFGVQTVPTYEITQARIEVMGPGMTTDSATVSITAGKGTKEFNVPMGPNRVFTAFGLRADSTPVPGAVIGAVKTIDPGQNTVELNWANTPTAEVFTNFLQNGQAAMAINTNAGQVNNFVNSMILWGTGTVTAPLPMHPSLVNGVKIGQDMRASGGVIPAESVNYVKPWGRVSLRINGLPTGYKFDAWVDDPASPLMVDVSGGVPQTIGPVHAGTWNLHIVIKDAAKTAEKRIQESITLVNGQLRSITVDLAGPTDANVDFTSHNGEIFPDLSVPEMNASEYRITVN